MKAIKRLKEYMKTIPFFMGCYDFYYDLRFGRRIKKKKDYFLKETDEKWKLKNCRLPFSYYAKTTQANEEERQRKKAEEEAQRKKQAKKRKHLSRGQKEKLDKQREKKAAKRNKQLKAVESKKESIIILGPTFFPLGTPLKIDDE